MNKSEKINFIINVLEDLFPKIEIPLDHKDPYTLLIAVLLSAQSTDAGVNKITPILFKKADNPYDMVKLSVEEIRDIIRPVGLSPMKSKGIHGLSKILMRKRYTNGLVQLLLVYFMFSTTRQYAIEKSWHNQVGTTKAYALYFMKKLKSVFESTRKGIF